MDYASGAIIGERSNQEDYGRIEYSPVGSELLAIVSDGIGGNNAGEVASRVATEEFHRSFAGASREDIPSSFKYCLRAANLAISRESNRRVDYEGMGCTLVAAFFHSRKLYWISVGDSLLLLFRGSTLKRINDDHSMAPLIARSVSTGKITREEAANHPHRNALRSALSGGEIEIIDSPEEPLALKAGDVIVLGTDGLLSLSIEEIELIISQNLRSGAESICDALLAGVRLKRKLNQDNTLVHVVIPDSTRTWNLKGNVLGVIGVVVVTLALVTLILADVLIPDRAKLFPVNYGKETGDAKETKQSKKNAKSVDVSAASKQINLGNSDVYEESKPTSDTGGRSEQSLPSKTATESKPITTGVPNSAEAEMARSESGVHRGKRTVYDDPNRGNTQKDAKPRGQASRSSDEPTFSAAPEVANAPKPGGTPNPNQSEPGEGVSEPRNPRNDITPTPDLPNQAIEPQKSYTVGGKL